MKQTLDYLNKLLKPKDKVVIACSGGPDSMFLLHLLLKIKKIKKIDIICAHVNHNLREESLEEYQFVKKFCQQEKIQFVYYEIKKYQAGNIEAIARKKRYDFFNQVVKKYQANYLMTAHHGDDLVETILMRLTRGSNLQGYSGFNLETKFSNYNLIRPLIFMTKEEILNYMDDNNYKYYIDRTNQDEIYTRNRYRKNILPILKKENKNIHLKYLEFNKEINDCTNYINKIVQEKLTLVYHDNTINIDKLKLEDKYIINKIIEKILKDIYQDNIDYLNKKHHQLIINLIKNNKPNIKINLPLNISFVKEYNIIKVVKETMEEKDYQFVFEDYFKHKNYEIKKINISNKTDNNYLYLNSKEIIMPLIIRNKKQGDKIEVKNLNGHKKVKDIMIENKLPLSKRKEYPILVDSNENILWIPGVKKSKFDKAKTKNYDIILKYQEIKGEKYE